MPVYKSFDKSDVLFSRVHTTPRTHVTFDLTGWHSNTGASASLSLYSGPRSRAGDSGLSIQPLDQSDVTYVTGSYPALGQIRYVNCTSSQITETTSSWGDRHYSPIEILFDGYGAVNPQYFIGSYDRYSLLIMPDYDTGIVSPIIFPSGPPLTGSITSMKMTAEAWIKPLWFSNNFVLSQQDAWSLRIGYDGQMIFSVEYMSASIPWAYGVSSGGSVTTGSWHHVAVTLDSLTASFYIDGQKQLTSSLTSAIGYSSASMFSGSLSPYVVGAYIQHGQAITGPFYGGYNGFIFEERVWNVARTQEQISGSMMSPVSPYSLGLVHYGRMNDGSRSTVNGYGPGLGVLDQSTFRTNGYLDVIRAPNMAYWQPNDHPSFVVPRREINKDMAQFKLIHVPSMFYGRQIRPGSVSLSDATFNDFGIERVFVDDGRGSLYLSGSMTRSMTGEDYDGTKWAKVGNVFYTEGLIVVTDPVLFGLCDTTSHFWDESHSLFTVDFSGEKTIYTKTLMCRMDAAEYNASNNKTFSYLGSDPVPGTYSSTDNRFVVKRDGTTYVTAIGLYNKNRELVAVAKLAQPIRKRDKDKLDIKLRFDW